MSSSRLRSPGILVAAALVGLATGIATAKNYGRASAPNEVILTSVSPEGDEDLFTFQAGPGFKVSGSAKKAKGATLLPLLDLLDPHGSPVTSGITTKATASSAKVSAVLEDGGLFALRLRGTSGTGDCTLSWKLAPAKFPPVKKDPMAADTQKDHLFSATGGALLSWSLSFKGDGAAQVIRVLDPDGVEVPYDATNPAYVTRKLTSEKVSNLPIPAARPGGTYRLVVFNDLLPSAVNLAVKVALPKLPKATAALAALEPSLISADRAVGGCGSPVVVTGENLSESPRGFYFDEVRSLGAVVDGGSESVPGDATTISCRAPGGQGTVDLVFEAADGQVAVLPSAFTFDPLPTVTSFGPVVGPGQGGVLVTIDGIGFQTEGTAIYEVLVGGIPGTQVQVVDSATVRFLTPAHVAGPKSVVLRDQCGQTVTAPGEFTYGVGLFITNIRPDAVPVFGGVPVVISGSNFGVADDVFLDDVLINTTPVMFGSTVVGHRIAAADLPAHAAGKVDVKVVSQAGPQTTRVDGLAFFTFADATATAIPAASATEDWGGVTNALIDRDGDGTADWLVLGNELALSATRPGTRLLVNNGSGVFTDATAAQMPAVEGTEGFGTNKILAGRLNADGVPDLFLSISGVGVAYDKGGDGTADWNEARMLNRTTVDPWIRLLFPDTNGIFRSQPVTGAQGLLSIVGKRFCDATWACVGVDRPNVCYLYDADFRSDGGTIGDLDGDSDADLVLVNRSSLATFTGLSQGIWVGCYYGLSNYQYYEAKGYGSAMRILTSSSNGGLSDRTAYLLDSPFSMEEDFRAAAAAIGDVNGDFLNDIVLVHDEPITKGGNPVSAMRIFRQLNTGNSIKYKIQTGVLPSVNASTDDWRGDAVSVGDLNNDIYRDIVVALDDDPVVAGSLSTRVLMQVPGENRLEDKTAQVLASALPAGDDGRARALIVRDLDRDGDIDMLLSGPDDPGNGGRRTRLLLNVDKDLVTGLPVFLDASSLLPAPGSDPGNAMAVAVGDVTGDDQLDIILTDTHQTAGTPVKRTRIWKQVR